MSAVKNSIVALAIMLLVCSPVNAEDKLNLSQYKGKIVYLDFWASWCKPCKKSFPWMNKMRETYSNDQLVILAVNLDKEKKLADEFLAKNPAKFTIIYDENSDLAKQYQIPGMPSSILFDQNGKVIKVESGFFEKKIPQYEKAFQQAITNL
ncbi:MAG: TlpA family protein disulfide reductase [Gammaproteobacteria bacterium]|nr:TlpA family protein disulfide reductase [Gammaproteobacteria bacterium]MDH5629931.1 TlpA family protein disulfide reductase [Gammaproteobacteria bacterium]